MENLDHLYGVVGVTLAYLFMYGGIFIGGQVFAKIRVMAHAKKRGVEWYRNQETDPFWEMADRTVQNTLEQMNPFLVALWLHAIFVDPDQSTKLGWVYVIARFFFPVFWSVRGTWNVLVELSTQPNYAVYNFFWVSLLYKVTAKEQLSVALSAKGIPLALAMVLIQIGMTLVSIPCGFGLYSVLRKGFATMETSEETKTPSIKRVDCPKTTATPQIAQTAKISHHDDKSKATSR